MSTFISSLYSKGTESYSSENIAFAISDALIILAVYNKTTFIAIDPTEKGYAITCMFGTSKLDMEEISPSIGNIVISRIINLAGLNLLKNDQLGKLKVKVQNNSTELLIAVRKFDEGFHLEIQRIFGINDINNQLPLISQYGTIGQYKIKEEIGKGGMGIVFCAEHEPLQRKVAIKILHSTYAFRSDTCFRFLREARAASKIKHPGIVQVIDFGSFPDGRPFLVMEYVDAPTLRKIISKGKINPSYACNIAILICSALIAAHKNNIIHRDLKPENIFVLNDGEQIKIGDFGSSKVIDNKFLQNTPDSLILGTPLYMAPEYAKGMETDVRTDIYSVGCILYEMLTGNVPFVGKTIIQTINKHINDPIPSDINLYPQFEDAVKKMMEKSPDNRYQTFIEVENDLQKIYAKLSKPNWKTIFKL